MTGEMDPRRGEEIVVAVLVDRPVHLRLGALRRSRVRGVIRVLNAKKIATRT